MGKWTLRLICTSVVVVLLAGSAMAVPPNGSQLAQVYTPKLERILTENIMPFWFDKSLDTVHGGYTINFGNWRAVVLVVALGPGTKTIVTQARMVWLFSRMASAGYRQEESLKAAELGYRFLKDKMWDPNAGGFYWEVDATGDKKISPDKHLYGQL